MRKLLIFSTLIWSATVFGHEIEITTQDKAALIESKLVVNPGRENEYTVNPPWFLLGMGINNTTPAPIEIISIDLTCVGDFNVFTYSNQINKAVPAGAAVPIEQYVSRLPITQSKKHHCKGLVLWSCPRKNHLTAIQIDIE